MVWYRTPRVKVGNERSRSQIKGFRPEWCILTTIIVHYGNVISIQVCVFFKFKIFFKWFLSMNLVADIFFSSSSFSSSRSSDGNSSLLNEGGSASQVLPYSLRATGVWSGQIPFLSGL